MACTFVPIQKILSVRSIPAGSVAFAASHFQTNVYSFSIRAFVGFCDERQLFMDERLVCRDFASPFIHGAGIVYEAQ